MRCTLCPRFSASPLCQRCTTHVEHATRQILAAVAGPLALHLQQHAEQEERAATIAAQAAAAAPLPDAPTTGDLAVSGEQGDQAHDLLDTATARGQRLLQQITRAALTRALKSGPKGLRGARSLYSKAEREALSSGLASILAPATLLGRSRIREQMDPAQFADWSRFDGTLQPMAPEKALAYFQSLTPSLTGDPKRFGTDQRRKAFTLAVATEKGLLDRVKGVLAGGLASGESTTSLTVQVQDLLDRAGVSSRNPQYANMICRTNLADAYNTGQMEEMQDPDVKDFFPVWRYDGVDDSRASLDHKQHFGKYFPNGVAFDKVRGKRRWNCRCTPTPVNQFDWEDLQAQGARIEPGYGSAEKPKAITQPKAKPTPPAQPAPRKSLGQLTPADVQGMSRKELLEVAQEYGLQPGKRTTETLRQRIATDIEMGIAKPATVTPEPAMPTTITPVRAVTLPSGVVLPRKPETVEQAVSWIQQNGQPSRQPSALPVTVDEVAQALGVSREQASQMMVASKNKLALDVQYEPGKGFVAQSASFKNPDDYKPLPTIASAEQVATLKADLLLSLNSGQTSIADARARIPAPDKQAFDDAVLGLLREKKIRMLPINDMLDFPVEAQGGIASGNKVFGWIEPATTTTAPTPTPQQPAVNPVATVLDAAQRLAGSNNRVTIADLQAATGLDLDQLHQAIDALRRQGVLSGSGIEGRASVDDRTLAAAIRGLDGEVIGSVSLRPRR